MNVHPRVNMRRRDRKAPSKVPQLLVAAPREPPLTMRRPVPLTGRRRPDQTQGPLAPNRRATGRYPCPVGATCRRVWAIGPYP